MKHLKTFESYIKTDITEDIAVDLLPRLEEIKKKSGIFTIEDFENYMKERGADSHTIDLVMSNLVSMGFEFDIEQDEEDDSSLDFELKNKIY